MRDISDPLAPLQRKESNISFPEANVQTLRLGFCGSASFVCDCLKSPLPHYDLCWGMSIITGGVAVGRLPNYISIL